jgi:hypothetical protein
MMDGSRKLVIDRGAPRAQALGILILGLGLMLAGYLLYTLPNRDQPLTEYVGALIVAGGAFAVLGVMGLLWRSTVVVDGSGGVAVESRGVLVATHRRTIPIASTTEVLLQQISVASRHQTHNFFPVKLIGSGKPFILSSLPNYLEGRRLAEEAARCLQVPLRDQAGPATYTEAGERQGPRAPDVVNASLRAQAQMSKEEVPLPVSPAANRIRTQRYSDGAVFELPVWHRPVWILLVVVTGALVLAVALAFYIETSLGDDRNPLFYVAIALPAVIGVAALVALAYGIDRTLVRERIAAGPVWLQLEIRTRFRTFMKKVPADEIEEFGYTQDAVRYAAEAAIRHGHGTLDAPALIARSDRATLVFAIGLTRPEQVWLHDMIRYLLADGSRALG